MPSIPDYVANQGIDVAQAPDLRLDDSIGRGLQQLGATGSDVALRWQQQEDQKRRFNAEQQLIRLSSDLDGVDVADAQKMASDGTGWRASRQTVFQQRRDAFLNTIPEDLREEFQTRADTLGQSYLNRANATELKALGAYSLDGLDKASNNLLNRTYANPAGRKAAEETMAALINAAPGLSTAEKQKLLAAVPGRFDEAAVTALVESGDYEGALGITGSGAGYLTALRQTESGGNDAASPATSSALGRYQFVEGTWNGVASSPEGKAAGLQPIVDGQPDPRLDPMQQEAAVRILTAGNAKTLQASGYKPTERNLYLAHFLGDGGAVKMLNAIVDNPDQSAAAAFPAAAKANRRLFYDKAGNERTVEEAYRVITRNFSGEAPAAEDMSLTAMASPDWGRMVQLRRTAMSAIEGRERQREAAAAQVAAQQEAQLKSQLGLIGIQINDAKLAGDVARLGELRKQAEAIGGQIGFDKVDTIVNQAGTAMDAAGAEHREAQRILTAPPGTLDARSEADRNGVDSAYRLTVLPELSKPGVTADVRAAREAAFAGQVGMVPDTMKSRVNAALTAGSPEQILEAAATYDRLIKTNPTFAGAFSEDAQRMAEMVNLSRQYGDEGKAVEKAQAMLQVSPADREARRATLVQDKGKEIGDPAGTYLREQVDVADHWDVDPDLIPDTMRRAFDDLVEREYTLTGSKETAYKLAWRQLDAKWGVSEINGAEQIVPWAPEKFYGLPDMSVSDNAAWQREQAVADARELQGDLVLEPAGAAPLEDRLQIVLHPRVPAGPDGKPVYALTLDQPDGGVVFLLDPATGRPAVWAPDAERAMSSSEAAQADMTDLQRRVDRVRMLRAGGSGPALDVFNRMGSGSAR